MALTDTLNLSACKALIVACVVSGFAGFAPEAMAHDPLLDQVLADIERHDVKGWAYTQKINVTAMGEEAVEVVSRFDPSKPEGEQVTIISIRPDDQNEDHDSHDSGHDIPEYADLADLLENDVELVREDEKSATYHLKAGEYGKDFKFGDIHINDDGFPEDLDGEITVVKGEQPFISHVRLFMGEPKGSVFVARFKKFDISFSFAPEGAEGIMLARDFRMDMDLTTLVFIHVNVDLDMEFSDFAYVGEYAN